MFNNTTSRELRRCWAASIAAAAVLLVHAALAHAQGPAQQAVVRDTVNSSESQDETKKAPAAAAKAATTAHLPASYAARLDAGRKTVDDLKSKGASKTQVAAASLSFANDLARLQGAQKQPDPANYDEARRQYTQVLEQGGATQQLAAHNNLAILELNRGSYAAAVQQFQAGLPTAQSVKDPEARSRYLFNYARALERAPAPAAAKQVTDTYRESFLAAPQRADAAVAGARFALSRADGTTASNMIGLLVAHGHAPEAEGLVRASFNETKTPLSPQDSFAVDFALLDLLPAQGCGRKCFDERWRATLTAERSRSTGDTARLLDLIALGYADAAKLPQAENAYQMRGTLGLAQWQQTQVRAVSRYFSRLGTLRAPDTDLLGAYRLYSMAFALDRENSDAALRKANLLSEKRQQLDADGSQLRRFVDDLFSAKGEAYRGDDRSSILRLHTLLGTIFYTQKMWGNPYDPRTAIFQLEHAASTHKTLASDSKTGEVPFIPGVYAMLATCYEKTGRPDLAYSSYLDAAQESVRQQDKERALQSLEALPSLTPYMPNPTQQQRRTELEGSAKSLSNGL